MEPGENERWLEIVITTKNNKRTREEAVLLATRKITSYFSIQGTVRSAGLFIRSVGLFFIRRSVGLFFFSGISLEST